MRRGEAAGSGFLVIGLRAARVKARVQEACKQCKQERVQWVDPSIDPKSRRHEQRGEELELRSAVSGLRLFGSSSLYDASWNLMTCVRTGQLGGPRGEEGVAGNIGCSIDALGRTW